MKRITAVIIACLATLATAAPASAVYPVDAAVVESSPAVVGSNVTISVSNFCPNTTVDFTLDGTPVGSATSDASGNASISITAPGVPGTYTLEASADDGSCVLSEALALVVNSSGLPATGSNTTTPGLQIALMAVLVGGALVAIAAVRRRSNVSA